MLDTQSPSKVRPGTPLTLPTRFRFWVKPCMFTRRNNLKILWPVVLAVVVNVVNHFPSGKKSSDDFLNDKPMLPDFSVGGFVGMVRGFYEHITLADYS